MSLTPYKSKQPSIWRPYELGQYLSFQTRRMYHFLKDIAPVLVKSQLRQIGRDAVDGIPLISTDAKRDIKRWLGDYDPKHFSSDFHHVWTVFDVYRDGIKGIDIHFSITVRGLKGLRCYAGVYFYFESWAKLKDYNNRFKSYDGQVAVGSDFTPAYHDTLYHDFSIFMPYSELHLAKGTHNLIYQIELYHHSSGTFFGKGPSQHFRVTER